MGSSSDVLSAKGYAECSVFPKHHTSSERRFEMSIITGEEYKYYRDECKSLVEKNFKTKPSFHPPSREQFFFAVLDRVKPFIEGGILDKEAQEMHQEMINEIAPCWRHLI